MKKLMFIFLFVIPLCEAADVLDSWQQVVQGIPNIQEEQFLYLVNNQITAIPDDLDLAQLISLNLSNNQLAALPANLDLPILEVLFLSGNQLTALPANFGLPMLEELYLNQNHIDYVDPQILHQFPILKYLNLSQNSLTQENIEQLRAAARQANRKIQIIADDIGPQYTYAGSIRPAKRK